MLSFIDTFMFVPYRCISLYSSQVLWFPLLETMMASQKQGKGFNNKHKFQGNQKPKQKQANAHGLVLFSRIKTYEKTVNIG